MQHKNTETQSHQFEPIPQRENRAARIVVDAAYSVHRQLGPGLLESVYDKCLAHAIRRRGLVVQRQVFLPIEFEDLRIEGGLRIDMVVDNCLVVELKAVEIMLPVHRAQLLTYVRLSGYRLGLLINFNVDLIGNGIRRVAC